MTSYELAIADYHIGLPIGKILQTYGISKTSFYRVIKQFGVAKRTRDNYSNIEIDIAINAYTNGLSTRAAGKLVEASGTTVLRWLRNSNTTIRHLVDYGGDDNYFEDLDTDHKLYWFGFLAADGSAKKKYLVINLGIKDWDHLELFKSYISYSRPIMEIDKYDKKLQKLYKIAHFSWGSKKIVSDLQRHGILQIKAGDFTPLAHLNNNQLRSFLRGYFDGDGSICVNTNNQQYTWYICDQYPQVLEYLMSRCPVVLRYNATKGGRRWAVRYHGNRIVSKICIWLYDGATVCLPRKLERAEVCCGRKLIS